MRLSELADYEHVPWIDFLYNEAGYSLHLVSVLGLTEDPQTSERVAAMFVRPFSIWGRSS